MRLTSLALSGFLLALLPAAAFAQNTDMRAVSQRLSQMERQMSQLSRDVYKDGGAVEQGGISPSSSSDNSGLAAAMDSRLSALEGEIRRINNRLDEQEYANNQLKSQFELFKGDLEVRLNDMSGQHAAAAPAPATASAQPDTTPLSPSNPPPANAAAGTTAGATAATGALNYDSPATLYDQAFQALREQNYPQAETGFNEFLKRYPKDQLAGNAKYWLGETYYVRGDYARAARVFAEGYQAYPKSSKGADNLLKLGLSLSQLNKKQEACVTFSQLQKDYKNAAAVIKQRAEAEKQKLACTV